MNSLWKITYKHLTDITPDERKAIEQVSDTVDWNYELYLVFDFEDQDPEIIEAIEELKSQVRPKVFKILKKLAKEGASFTIL